MTIDKNTDPVAMLLRTPGNWVRIAALALALAAPFTLAVIVNDEVDYLYNMGLQPLLSASGQDLSFLSVAFPVLIGVALLSSIVPTMARYTRIVDLLAALAGLAICTLVVATMSYFEQRFATIIDYSRIPNVRKHIPNAFEPTTAIYVIVLATLLMTGLLSAPVVRSFFVGAPGHAE